MKKGMALEGYIQEDGTVRPMRQYDDTELRAKIQTNKDDIDNLKSKASSLDTRVEYLEEHGGAEDPTKANKVESAVAGNFASLQEDGDIQDSGCCEDDFAAASHTHGSISNFTGTDGVGASVEVGEDRETQGLGVVKITVKGDGRETDSESVTIHCNNIGNLNNALSGNAGNKISDFTGINGCGASVEVGEDPDSQGEGIVKITVKGDSTATDSDSAKINYGNIGNLQRALLPAAPPTPNGTSPITNGQVYTALHELPTALPVVHLDYDGQDGWNVVNSGDALNLLSENNQVVMVEVRCSVEVNVDKTVNFRSIGNLFANETETQARDIEVGLVVDGRMFIFVSNVQDWRDLNGEYYDDDAQDCTLTSTNLYPSNS